MPPQAAGVLAFGEQSVELSRQGRASVENLLRESPQRISSENLLRAPPLSWRWSVPRAPRYPKPPRTRSAGRRSGPGPTRSPPPLPRGPPPLPPHANSLTPQVLPRDEQGVVHRLAVRPAASPFTPRTRPPRPRGRGYSCRGTRDQSKTSDPQYFLSLPV